jgi:hypothetical protein
VRPQDCLSLLQAEVVVVWRAQPPRDRAHRL